MVGRGWVPAGELRDGDELVGEHEESLFVESARIDKEEADHYNFEVEDWHTYFVSGERTATAVFVHNLCFPDGWNVTRGENSFIATYDVIGTGDQIGILATLDKSGFLETGIYTKVKGADGKWFYPDLGSSKVSGSDLLRAARDHFGDRVKGLWGIWGDGDNFDRATKALSKNISKRAAAWKTWTGERALEDFKFSNVTIREFSGEQIVKIVTRPDGTPGLIHTGYKNLTKLHVVFTP